MDKIATLTATLKEINYVSKLSKPLSEYDVDDLVNEKLSSKGSFILTAGEEEYAMSQWVSPKRTRSFPFSRVYDTLCRKNRVTLIPFCKDEGKDGDRDFLQWDTVSLMSLLNVHVIICYYYKAQKNIRPKQMHKNKINTQIVNYGYVKTQLMQLQKYHSSALHWNLKQMENLSAVGELTLAAYQKISADSGVELHGYDGIRKRTEVIEKGVSEFKELSQRLSKEAQNRESLTTQPKEKTIGGKAKITLTNLLGGVYHLTADEYFVLDGCVFLVEKKHSKDKKLPSLDDIKDAFIKLALFSNINELNLGDKNMPYYAAVGLTSNAIQGVLHSKMNADEIDAFLLNNNIIGQHKNLILAAVSEARCNDFGLFVINANDAKDKQECILKQFIR